MLEGKNIIIGVTGSIAAYKAAYLVRMLAQRKAHVRVAMTSAASHFVSPLTFSSLSQSQVALEMYPSGESAEASGSWHIDWSMWADAMVIAPATATTIAKLAVGLSDNALTVIATALRGKLFVAPAMDLDMYRYPALKNNIATLRSFGVEIIPPEVGELASGLIGEGRLAEVETIVEHVESYFARTLSLRDQHVLITAGPTHEPIDPVRYIANRSSGKMGYALAEEAHDRGATVTLISGPTSLPSPSGVNLVKVTTAEQMATAVDAYKDEADVVISAAAVADFTPSLPVDRKLKRREMEADMMKVELQPTRDILRSVGTNKRENQIVVGFALETEKLLESARAKLVEKGSDLIVANPANEERSGFGVDTNRITLITANEEIPLPLLRKSECAQHIFNAIEALQRGESIGAVHESS